MTMPPLARRIFDWLLTGPRGWPDLKAAFADSSNGALDAAIKFLKEHGLIVYRQDMKDRRCFMRSDQLRTQHDAEELKEALKRRASRRTLTQDKQENTDA